VIFVKWNKFKLHYSVWKNNYFNWIE